jgi:hypothetical protein
LKHHDLSDEERRLLEPLLPLVGTRGGVAGGLITAP